jgi:hypothetical protein
MGWSRVDSNTVMKTPDEACRLEVRRVAVQESKELNTFAVGLYENNDGQGRYLIFQRSLQSDAQDSHLGMNTYAITTELGATVYGGLASYAFDENISTLKLALEEQAAEDLGICLECELRLAIPPQELRNLLSGLARVLAA